MAKGGKYDEFELFQRNLQQTNMNKIHLAEKDSDDESLINGFKRFECLEEKPKIESKQDVDDMTKIIQMMMHENQRRDAMFERMLLHMSRQPLVQPATNIYVPDFTKNIDFFNGEGSSAKAKDWITKVITMKDMHGWNEGYAIELVKAKLIGAANCWFEARCRELISWDIFVKAFYKTFIGQDSLPEKWKKMNERMQKKGESVQAYFHEKLKLCLEVGCNFRDTKEQILVGLLSHTLCNAVSPIKHENADELLHDLIYHERIIERRTEKRNPNVAQDRERKTDTKNERPLNIEKKRIPEFRPSTDGRGKPLCFVCKRYGHVSKYCRYRDLTNSSQESGQNSYNSISTLNPRNIPSNNTVRESSNPNSINIVAQEKRCDKNKYLKEVIVNDNIPAKCMVDAGSAVSTITEEFVLKNNITCIPKTEILYGFGEKKVTTNWTTTLKIKLDEVEETVDIIVVPDKVQPVEMLIGRNFTELPEISYIKFGETLHFGYKTELPFSDLNWKVPPRKQAVRAARDTILLNHGINFVEIENEEVSKWLPIYNRTDKDIFIGKGQKVGEIRGTDKVKEKNYQLLVNNKELKPITMEQVNMGPLLKPNEQIQLLELLNNYRDVFALKLNELGCTDMMTVKIEDNGIPIQTKPYRTNQSDREQIKEIIKEWKENGIVRDSESPYASPVILIPKSSGEKRLVIDFRRLNSQTVKKTYPIPNLDDCFESLAGTNMYCMLDLMSGYLQVPLSEESKHKTAFITQDDKAEFERLCFGLVNAPYEFSRLMKTVFGHLRNDTIVWYLDDILVPSKDFDDMCQRLVLVFEALRKAKLTLKLCKCVFGQEKVKYLGFELSGKGIQPNEQKLTAIQNFSVPKNRHELKRFLGLTGFFRRFIPRYAELTKPLTDLTKTSTNYEWAGEQMKSFENLKSKLQQKPVLQLYNPKAKTELHCDASSQGVAGMLLQENADGKMHLVYCVSKKTSEVEQKYHSSKLELLAIVWSIERLRPMLLGIEFTVVSDCQALVYLNAKKTLQPQIARWYAVLAEYNFEIKYRAGQKMSHVDSLSRAAVETESEEGMMEEIYEKRLNIFQILTEVERIMMIQRSDRKIRELIDILRKPQEDRNKEENNRIQNYEMNEGRLYKRVKIGGEERWLYVIPDSMRKATVIKYHDQMGHWSVDKTLSKILNKFWFKNMRRYIRKHINGCFECLMMKYPGGKKPGMLHPPRMPERPMVKIHLDHLGPFPKSSTGKMFILVVVDAFSRFIKLFPTRTTSSEETVKKTQQFISLFGAPKVIVTDRGTAFMGNAFQELCTKYDIQHKATAARYPQANGIAEVKMRSIVPVIVTSINFAEEKWDKDILEVERKINNTINKTTACTPFECLFGYTPNFEDARIVNFASRQETEQDIGNKTHTIREKARNNVEKSQAKYKQNYDRKHYEGVTYDVGDIVVVKTVPISTGQPTKTQYKYRGPLVVVEKLSGDTYRLEKLNKIEGSTQTTVAHISQMKLYQNHDELESEDEIEEMENENLDEERNESSDNETNSTSETDSEEEWKPVSEEVEEDEIDAGTHNRPQRRIQRPLYLNDYQLEVKQTSG